MDVRHCFSYIILMAVVGPGASRPVTLIDLTYEMSAKTPTSPHHKRFESLNLKNLYPNPDSPDIRFAVQEISGSEHAGTHMDAPLHFKPGGLTMEQIPIEHFTGPAVVINVEEQAQLNPLYQVTVEDLINWERKYGKIPENAFVLMNSGWDKFSEDAKKFVGNDRADVYDTAYPGFSGEACKWIVENRKVNGLGSDTVSADFAQSGHFPCHHVLLHNDVIILENIFNVGALPPQGATLRAYPLKIKGGTGAPTRIIASIDIPRRTAHLENEL